MVANYCISLRFRSSLTHSAARIVVAGFESVSMTTDAAGGSNKDCRCGRSWHVITGIHLLFFKKQSVLA